MGKVVAKWGGRLPDVKGGCQMGKVVAKREGGCQIRKSHLACEDVLELDVQLVLLLDQKVLRKHVIAR